MSSMVQRPPLRVDAPNSTETGAQATFIFLHGFGDDAEGWINIAEQFQAAKKLPHLNWIFPNAPQNHDAMTQAWYTPTEFSPIPVGRSGADAVKREEEGEDEEFEEEGEDEIWTSVEYICTLVDAEIQRGIKPERIIVGGFSQGCAISLVLGLASRYKAQLGGIVGLSGYLPRGKMIKAGRDDFTGKAWEERAGEKMKVFLAHGTKDMLVPMRVFRDAKARVASTVGEDVMDVHEYEGLGHVASGAEFRDMCTFLEKIVPE